MVKKLRVGVLFGGKSIEHEVSFNSGRTVCDHLDTHRYEIIPLYQKHTGAIYILPWHFLHRGKTTDFVHRLSDEAEEIPYDQLKDKVDFIYIALHGRYAEDGTLQGFLEILDIPYLGSKIFGSSLGMDKNIQRTFLDLYGFDVPNGTLIHSYEIDNYEQYKKDILSRLEAKKLHLPLVIKPHKEGSSLGISIIFSYEELKQALEKASRADDDQVQDVLIEEKIEGMEFCCIIITDYKTGQLIPLPVTEVVPENETHFFDYAQKYMPGRSIKFTPARCSENDRKKIQKTCIKLMKKLEFTNLSRNDGFLTKDGRVVLIDSNTLTGMGPSTFLFRQAAQIGMNHTKLINHLIETELQNYGMLSALEERDRQEENMQKVKKIKVAVLMGGNSNEREVSLESGRNIVYKLSPQKYEALPLFVTNKLQLYHLTDEQLVQHSTVEIHTSLHISQKISWSDLPKIADFVFIGLHGGIGENGAVQGTLEMLGIPYNGSSVLASSLCINKFKTNNFLKSKGFATPKSVLISKEEWTIGKEQTIKRIKKILPFPIILKPVDDGCSVGVVKIKNQEEIIQHIERSFLSFNKKELLVEECITGIELTVGVIGNQKPKALTPSQAITTKDILSIEEKFLPGAGENQTPAPLSPDVQNLVKKTVENAYKAVDCKGYARIDCFYQRAEESPTNNERVVIIEINTLPGMTPATCIFHQAAEEGIKPMDFIDTIIKLGFEEHSPYIKKEDDTKEAHL